MRWRTARVAASLGESAGGIGKGSRMCLSAPPMREPIATKVRLKRMRRIFLGFGGGGGGGGGDSCHCFGVMVGKVAGDASGSCCRSGQEDAKLRRTSCRGDHIDSRRGSECRHIGILGDGGCRRAATARCSSFCCVPRGTITRQTFERAPGLQR